MKPPVDRLIDIFEKQAELARTFHRIEKENKVWEWDHDLVVPVTTVFGQERMRSLGWRVIEELAEALDATTVEKTIEELIDVGHYLVELCISAGVTIAYIQRHLGITPEGFDLLDQLFAQSLQVTPSPSLNDASLEFVVDLGLTMHGLKAKPHKVNPKPTDVAQFHQGLVLNLVAYATLLRAAYIMPAKFYEGYLDKNMTNHQRIIEQQ